MSELSEQIQELLKQIDRLQAKSQYLQSRSPRKPETQLSSDQVDSILAMLSEIFGTQTFRLADVLAKFANYPDLANAFKAQNGGEEAMAETVGCFLLAAQKNKRVKAVDFDSTLAVYWMMSFQSQP